MVAAVALSGKCLSGAIPTPWHPLPQRGAGGSKVSSSACASGAPPAHRCWRGVMSERVPRATHAGHRLLEARCGGRVRARGYASAMAAC
jgi:hypothetical protein